MADITVDVNLPSSVSVDVTSPTQALATNISIPGPQGPRGAPTSINALIAENIIITGADGNIIYNSGLNTIFISGNSGYFQSAVNSLTTNLNNTGANLNTSINSLSGLFTGYTGSLDATYATDSQLNSTGNTLNIKIDNLSGYVNSQDSNISNNLASTGSSLQTNINTVSSNLNSTGSNLENKITSLSGTLTGSYVTKSNGQFTNRPVVNGTGVLLSGEVANLPNTVVYTTGNQTISGNKTFINNINISGTSYFQDINISNLNELILSGTKITITGNSGVYSYTNIYISGNPVLTGVDLSSYLTSSNASTTYATITNLASTGSTLVSSINSLNSAFTGFTGNLDATYATDSQLVSTGSTLVSSINSLSGTLTSNYATINNLNSTGNTLETNIASTGNTLNTKINSLSGDSVLTYNNQTINGQKTFTEDLVVQKSGFFWSGIKIGLNSIIISEESIKIGGDPVVVQSTFTGYTGDVVNTYATITNLASTGSTLNNSINSLSGTLTGTYATINNLASTGSTLQSNINTLTNNLNSTDNTLDNKLGSLSGTLTSDYATIINLASTGSNLQTQINNLDNIYATDTSVTSVSNNLASTGGTLNTKINSLSGSSVLLYGDQSVGGIKTFRDNVYINNLYVTGTETIVNTNNFNVQSPYVLLNLTGGAVDGGIFFVTGSGLTGVNDTGPIIGFDHSNKFKFGVSTRNSDLSTLPDIASVQDITAYSGFVDGKYSTIINLASTGSTLSTNLASTGSTLQTNINNLSNTYATITNLGLTGSTLVTNLASTGSTLDTKINTLSGYITGTNSTFTTNLASTGSTLNTKINNLSGYINSSSSNIVFTTGNQTISGIKSFAQDTTFGDSAQGDFLVISGNNFTVYGSGNFTSGLFVNGNAVLTGVNLSSYATTANLASTGSTLSSSINSLSGTLTSTYATISNLASTGSTLNSNINSLSGTLTSNYATITNLANTGSTLQTNINNLSGYINSSSSNIVFTTGDQTISGNKTFIGNHNISGNLNVTGNSNIRGTLDVTGLVVSGLGIPFILKSKSNATSVYFDPEEAGLQGVLYTNRITTNSISGPTGDSDLSILYNTINTTKVLKFQTQYGVGVLNRAILDSNGNFGIGSGISSVPSRFYVSGNSVLQGDLTVSGTLTTNQRPFVNGTGVLLSGEAAQVDFSTTVRTTGNQTISGIKSFANNIEISGTGTFFDTSIFVDEMTVSGMNLTVANGTGIFSFLNISGNYDIYSQIENSKKLAIAYAIAL